MLVTTYESRVTGHTFSSCGHHARPSIHENDAKVVHGAHEGTCTLCRVPTRVRISAPFLAPLRDVRVQGVRP